MKSAPDALPLWLLALGILVLIADRLGWRYRARR
jgi:hypothetical protein